MITTLSLVNLTSSHNAQKLFLKIQDSRYARKKQQKDEKERTHEYMQSSLLKLSD